MDCDKEYVFTIEWGSSTASQDKEGEVIATSDVRPTREQIEAVLPDFIGDIQQVPPKYSAIKVDGERAYDLARDGEAFEIPSREVTVYEAELVDIRGCRPCVIPGRLGQRDSISAPWPATWRTAWALKAMSASCAAPAWAPDEASNSISLAALEAWPKTRTRCSAQLLPLETVLDDVPQIEIDASDAAALKQGREIVLLPHLVEQWRSDRKADFDSDRLALTA